MPSLSFLIAAFDEEGSLRSTFDRCLAVARAHLSDFEIVLLDDGSRDRTAAVMEQIHQEFPESTVILRHERNLGIAATFEDLYRHATREWVFLIPADGEYPPEILPQCLALLPAADVVLCVRSRKNYTLYRSIISGLFRFLPRLLFGVDLLDPGSIKCVRRSLIQTIPTISRGVFVEAERLIRAAKRGYRIAHVEIPHRTRASGRARGAAWRQVSLAAHDLLRLWWHLTILREPA